MTLGLLAVLGFVGAVGPFATDMYLASFTQIADELGADASQVQLTLTAFFLGIGAGQLLLGPASDRFGRRSVLLWALGVFAVASVAMVFSPHIAVFVGLRAVQGFSGAAGIVIARAIAVDLSTGRTAVRALSLIATVTALGPLVAPPVGGVIAVVWGWRGVLAALAVVAIAMWLLTLLFVPESLPVSARHTGGIGETVGRFGQLLKDGRFIGFVLSFAFGFAAMISYISASPFVGQIVLGMHPLTYALGFAASALALITANLVNSRVAPRVGPERMLGVGLGLIACAGAALLVLVLTGTLVPATFIPAAFVLTGGAGLTMSNGSALALARADSARGSGAALLGATQFLIAGLASPVVGLWGERTALPMALVVLTCALVSLAAGLAALRGGIVSGNRP